MNRHKMYKINSFLPLKRKNIEIENRKMGYIAAIIFITAILLGVLIGIILS